MTTYAQGQAVSVTTNGYDAAGALVAQGGDTYPVTFGSDTAGRQTQLTTLYGEAAASALTQWKYNPATGLLTNKLDAAGKGAAYTYTSDGRPLRTTWARSNVWKENVYDPRGLVCSNRYSSSSMDVSYTYNAAGLPSLASSALGFSTSYAYSDSLVLTNETISGLDAPDSVFEIGRAVDTRQRPASTTLTHNGTNITQITYGYDSENRLSSMSCTNAQGRGCTLAYGYSGYLGTGYTLSTPTNAVIEAILTRDSYRRSQVTDVVTLFNSLTITTHSYTFDGLGRATNTERSVPPLSVSFTNVYAYNARSEVIGAGIDTNDYAYIYDNIGNNLFTSFNAVTNAYTVNNLNQYKAITNLLDLTGYRLLHDSDGNTTRIDSHSLSYDAENRLSFYMFGTDAYVTGTVRNAYIYDHHGRRVRKLEQECRVYDPGGQIPPTYWWHTNDVTTFVYDGWNLVHERIALTNGTTQEVSYFWGKDLSGSMQGAGGVSGLLATSIDGDFYFPCYDNNGNITAYIDESGSVIAYRQFDAFGNTVSKGGAMVDVFHFWFSTKYLDHDTGLYYYGYRYYSPMLQRWINRDPIEERGGVNLYEFCRNDVYNKIDYLGNVYVPQTISVKKCHAYLYIGHAKKERPIKWNFPSDGGAYGGAITCWSSSNNPEDTALRWPNAPFSEEQMYDVKNWMGNKVAAEKKYVNWNMDMPEHIFETDPVKALNTMWSKEALDVIKKTLFSKPHCCKIITFEIYVGHDVKGLDQIKRLVSKYNWQQGDTRRIKVYKGSEYED